MIPQELKAEMVERAMPEGWCSPEKAEAMAELIIEIRPKLSVELGVFGGRSLVAQAQALRYAQVPFGAVWGIDPWTVDAALDGDVGDANREWWAKLDIQAIRDQCLRGITERQLWPWVRVVVAKSGDCHKHFHGIDVLHIDGNHSEEVSTGDVMNWLPAVRSGGYVWFDDANWSTTKRAVQILEDQCEYVKEVTGCRLYLVR